MKTVNFCALVIAASVFAIAVEYVYGWTNVEPLVEHAGGMIHQWTDGRLGWDQAAGSVSALGGTAETAGQAN